MWVWDRLKDDFELPYEAVERLRLDNAKIGDHTMLQHNIRDRMRNDPDAALEVANLALHRTDDPDAVEELERHLWRSGSAWRAIVHNSRGALVARVPEEVQTRAKQVADVDDPAGRHLRAAWHAMYGRNPDADDAADEAVAALEWALCGLVTPDDRDATLGKAAARLRDAPHLWTWSLDPQRGADDDAPVRTLAALIGQVWATHRRHARQDDGRPAQTPAEAETILHAALTLVHAVREGLLHAR